MARDQRQDGVIAGHLYSKSKRLDRREAMEREKKKRNSNQNNTFPPLTSASAELSK